MVWFWKQNWIRAFQFFLLWWYFDRITWIHYYTIYIHIYNIYSYIYACFLCIYIFTGCSSLRSSSNLHGWMCSLISSCLSSILTSASVAWLVTSAEAPRNHGRGQEKGEAEHACERIRSKRLGSIDRFLSVEQENPNPKHQLLVPPDAISMGSTSRIRGAGKTKNTSND